jgi:hypothetical protein
LPRRRVRREDPPFVHDTIDSTFRSAPPPLALPGANALLTRSMPKKLPERRARRLRCVKSRKPPRCATPALLMTSVTSRGSRRDLLRLGDIETDRFDAG